MNPEAAALVLVSSARVSPSQIAALSKCISSIAIVAELADPCNKGYSNATEALNLLSGLKTAGFKLLGVIEAATEQRTCLLALKTQSQQLEIRLQSLLAGHDSRDRPKSRKVREQFKILSRNVRMRFFRQNNQKKTPILIPCFNNPTHCDQMLEQLVSLGLTDITFIDNASTTTQMRKWLNKARGIARVINLHKNVGPHLAVFEQLRFASLPRRFCVTDPDLVFNERLPKNFLDELALLCHEYSVGKVGFALDISENHLFHKQTFRNHNTVSSIYEWEVAFWRNPLGTLAAGDRFYEADIDTTFALYDKRYFDLNRFHKAIRVAGRFTAKHLPWYERCGLPRDEQELYARTQQFSVYHAPE
jgi:hypothetical protein